MFFYNLFPVRIQQSQKNKNIAEIITLIGKSACELNRIDNINYNSFSLYNSDTGVVYAPDKLIRETNIRNGTRLIMM